MRRIFPMLVAVAVVMALAIAFAVTSHSPSAQAEPDPVIELQSNYTVAQAQSFNRYPLYYLGDTFAGLPLTSVWKEAITAPEGTVVATKIAQAGPGADVSFIDFIYGSCSIPLVADIETCSVPIEVKMFPACARNLSLYQGQEGGPEPTNTTVRGAPAAYFDDGTRLEIQTSTATIVIWDSRNPPAILDVADALRRVNGSGSPLPEQQLPAPTSAAMDGTIAC